MLHKPVQRFGTARPVGGRTHCDIGGLHISVAFKAKCTNRAIGAYQEVAISNNIAIAERLIQIRLKGLWKGANLQIANI